MLSTVFIIYWRFFFSWYQGSNSLHTSKAGPYATELNLQPLFLLFILEMTQKVKLENLGARHRVVHTCLHDN